MWRTPITAPLLSSGTPSREQIPCSRRIENNATGEPLPHWNPNVLADRRFDAPGSGSNKLLRGGVEQQHGGCVDSEEFTHLAEQLNQEVFDVEVSERGIDQGVDPAQSVVIGGRHAALLTRRRHDQSLTHFRVKWPRSLARI